MCASSKKRCKGITLSDEQLRDGCRLGFDSHSDMSYIGAHATIWEVYEGQLRNVMPFNDTYTPLKDVKTVDAAFAYDSDDGIKYILDVNQALDFSESMEHSLLCPNQARLNGDFNELLVGDDIHRSGVDIERNSEESESEDSYDDEGVHAQTLVNVGDLDSEEYKSDEHSDDDDKDSDLEDEHKDLNADECTSDNL